MRYIVQLKNGIELEFRTLQTDRLAVLLIEKLDVEFHDFKRAYRLDHQRDLERAHRADTHRVINSLYRDFIEKLRPYPHDW